MPAIITHDSFGQDVYKELYSFIGGSRDEYEAFLLGNQGSDPLFYSVLVPRLQKFIDLGSRMHREHPNETLLAFKQSLSILDDREHSIGRAYLGGFLCHYLLDSNMHPLVYFNEYSLCDAGVDGFDRTHGSEVHATIESELDELVLFTKRGVTIAQFNPATQILKGSDFVLETISKMYSFVAMLVFGVFLPEGTFKSALKSFRRTEGIFCSPTGIKREVLGRVEELFRTFSFVRSMSPRPLEITENFFDNHEHATWENPFTGESCSKGFWDIFEETQVEAHRALRLIDEETFDLEAARSITHDLDFSGNYTIATLTVEESKHERKGKAGAEKNTAAETKHP